MRTAVPAPARRRAARALWILLAALALPSLAGADYDKREREAIAALPEVYRAWLAEVEPLITDEELAAFLAIEQDYQRDAFIKRFWRIRDPYPDTARNEFLESYQERVQIVRSNYGDFAEPRARILLLNGPPGDLVVARCSILRPLEVWWYAGSHQFPHQFAVVFYLEGNRYRLWRPMDGIDVLADRFIAGSLDQRRTTGELMREIVNTCRDGEKIAAGIAWVLSQGGFEGYEQVLARLTATPELREQEWVATFNAYTTDIPPDAPALPAELTVGYAGRRQGRTVLEGVLAVPREAAGTVELAGARSYNFLLTGEVLRDDELFDTFRYKFDLPAAEVVDEEIPLVFTRYLRPGDYRLVLRLEDLNQGAFFRDDEPITVPRMERAAPSLPEDVESARLLAEANAALDSDEVTVRLVTPMDQIQTGFVRFDTMVTGTGITRVAFALDGESVLTKQSPPFSVELDLGAVPRSRRLSAIAYGADGTELARDETLLNPGGHRFSVELVEPRRGVEYQGAVRAEAEVRAPEGQSVERVEVFLNETRVATLYQEPWTQTVRLPPEETMAYVRAVAYLPDGNSTEDLVFVNAPDYLEELDVQFVELYATALDGEQRPVDDLTREDFQVLEDGQPQEVARFEHVRDLPIHAAVLLDVSASMEGRLDASRQAALSFFEQAVEPRDRGALITFNDHPNLAVKFTNEVPTLGGGLAGLKAERGTALYDAVVFGLYYFNGVKGQRAMLVFSDGKDESSRFTWEQTLEYSRRAGVTIYSVAVQDEEAHKKLSRLADVTGGRSFFVKSVEELSAVYEVVQRELRSKYLIAYQSSNTTGSRDFRKVEVRPQRPGVGVKTMQGYYP